jgi:hypothetical protein
MISPWLGNLLFNYPEHPELMASHVTQLPAVRLQIERALVLLSHLSVDPTIEP